MERYLKGNQEIAHKLRGFDDAAAESDEKPENLPKRGIRRRGPSL